MHVASPCGPQRPLQKIATRGASLIHENLGGFGPASLKEKHRFQPRVPNSCKSVSSAISPGRFVIEMAVGVSDPLVQHSYDVHSMHVSCQLWVFDLFCLKRVVAPEFTPNRSPDGASLAENCRSECSICLRKCLSSCRAGHAIAVRSWRVMAVLIAVIANVVRTTMGAANPELGTRRSVARRDC